MKYTLFALAATGCFGWALLPAPADEAKDDKPGFVDLFNGRDLAGWRGGTTEDPRWIASIGAEAREALLAKWTSTVAAHWTVENGELVNDGHGDYLTTVKDYGDVELLVE